MVPTEAHYRVATKLCGFPRHSQNKVTSVSRLCNEIFSTYINKVHGGRVVRCRTCDREVVGSNPTHGCCAPTPTQRAIPSGSVNEYQRNWGVNWHTMRCTSPISMVVRLRLVSGWGLLNGDQHRHMGPWGSGKDLTFFILYYLIVFKLFCEAFR